MLKVVEKTSFLIIALTLNLPLFHVYLFLPWAVKWFFKKEEKYICLNIVWDFRQLNIGVCAVCKLLVKAISYMAIQ